MLLKFVILTRFEVIRDIFGGFTHLSAGQMSNDVYFGFKVKLFRRLLSCVFREAGHNGALIFFLECSNFFGANTSVSLLQTGHADPEHFRRQRGQVRRAHRRRDRKDRLDRCVDAWCRYVRGGAFLAERITPFAIRDALAPQLDLLAPEGFRNLDANQLAADLRINTKQYLPYMIYMNRVLDEDPLAKLLSPLPMRTHLVPRHIRINTEALIDL
ncbi:hypothetical protein BC828DRAFT_225713 [Blastocladiella britannica]|nr:hypothetical protein BC828DRAFT_225713 [Blastocladiella britannica]